MVAWIIYSRVDIINVARMFRLSFVAFLVLRMEDTAELNAKVDVIKMGHYMHVRSQYLNISSNIVFVYLYCSISITKRECLGMALLFLCLCVKLIHLVEIH